MKEIYRILVGKPEGKRLLEDQHTLQVIINMLLKENTLKRTLKKHEVRINRIHLVQDRIQR
jgi:hypothetical protein